MASLWDPRARQVACARCDEWHFPRSAVGREALREDACELCASADALPFVVIVLVTFLVVTGASAARALLLLTRFRKLGLSPCWVGSSSA